MTHRWLPADAERWRMLAQLALMATSQAERQQLVRPRTLANLRDAAARAYKARYPAPEADWPRFSQFIRLAEDYATSSDQWRRAWTAALESQAREILRRLGDPPPPTAASARAAAGARRPPWWVRD